MLKNIILFIYLLTVHFHYMPVEPSDHSLSYDLYPLSTFEENSIPSDNSFRVPKWLQTSPKESKLGKTRKRRFFMVASTISAKPELTFESKDLFQDISAVNTIAAEFAFDVPAEATLIGRGMATDVFNRTHFLTEVQNFFEGNGFHGRSCLLRSACELSEVPFDFGLLGEIVNYLFAITESSNEIDCNPDDEIEDYRMAKLQGQRGVDCSQAYPKCPLSLLNLLSSVLPFGDVINMNHLSSNLGMNN